MKMHAKERRAISPIIATVLIIAVTLIAAVAIGGFVFGVFGTSAQAAQIQVTGTTVTVAGFQTGTGGDITCVSTGPTAPYITLTNTGTAASQVTAIIITWGGANNNFALHAGTTCSVGGAGSANAVMYAQFTTTPKVSIGPTLGQSYSGTVTLSNGANLLFTGTWQ